MTPERNDAHVRAYRFFSILAAGGFLVMNLATWKELLDAAKNDGHVPALGIADPWKVRIYENNNLEDGEIIAVKPFVPRDLPITAEHSYDNIAIAPSYSSVRLSPSDLLRRKNA